MPTKGSKDLCIIHGSKVAVGPNYSCGLYCVWPKGSPNPEVIRDHAYELVGNLPGSVTPEQSGLVERQVRCENCVFYRSTEGQCGLYDTLNRSLPGMFELNSKVDKHGCCNAQTPIKAGS